MEILKNIVYAGVGLASVTADKVKESIEELVEKGMISDTEGKKIVDDFFKATEEKRNDFENKLKTTTEKITNKFEFLNKEKEVQILKDKIIDLENKLATEKKKNNKKAKTKTTNKKA